MKSLLKRSISSVIYALIVAVGLLGPQLLFIAVFGFAIAWTIHEFYDMAYGRRDFVVSRVLFIVSAEAFFILSFLSRVDVIEHSWVYLSLLPLMIAFMVPIWDYAELKEYGKIGYGAAGFLCVGLPLMITPILTVRSGQFDGMFLLCVFIIVSMTDVGAYFLGSSLGQRAGAWKLAPKISPKKSWWGLVGGIMVGSLFACLLSALSWLNLSVGHSLLLGALLSAGSVLGDLTESMWKRYFGVKDSGSLIPGHGGLYDRLDSVLVAIPLSVCYLEAFGLL